MRITVIDQTDLLIYLSKFRKGDKFEIHVVGDKLMIYAPGRVEYRGGERVIVDENKNPFEHVPDCNWNPEVTAKCKACQWEDERAFGENGSFERLLNEKDLEWLKELKLTI